MRDYIDMTGKTEEEAIEKALEQLGLDRDEVSVEILERAKSGFLGIGRADAKVRIRYGEEKPDPAAAEVPAPAAAEVSREISAVPAGRESGAAAEQTPRESRKAKRDGRGKAGEANGNRVKADTRQTGAADTRKARNAPEIEGNAEEGTPQAGENAGADTPKARKGGKAQKDAEARKAASKAAQRKNAKQNAPKAGQPDEGKASQSAAASQGETGKASQDESARTARRETGKASQSGGARENPALPVFPAPLPERETDDEKTRAIKEFLGGLLEHMEQPAEIRAYLTEEGRYKVILEGQGMGALIGRRGETLDAIQQLTNYAVNRNGNRVRIQLDAEGYREKREQSLRNLARKEAAKVVKFRRSRTLEPMNAYERHVIHTALQDFRGVTTYSTGVDPNRRVVVAYEHEKL